MHARIREAFV
uniref:Uncharacterized protein n=1 Tax=Arundo donax TaxID=35708 RepID=A0A0A9GHD0_ARUDO